MEKGKLQLPAKIDNETKRIIERSYLSAVEQIEDYEIAYIKNRIGKKVDSVKKEKLVWMKELAENYAKLFMILGDCENGKINLSKNTIQLIGAALFYFIDPYDIIPDDTMNTGYLDDFYVLMLCLDNIEGIDKDIVFSKLQ